MAIDPLGAAGLPPRPDAARSDGAAAGDAIAAAGASRQQQKTVAAADQVELSATSTNAASDAAIPNGTIDAARLRELTARLAEGGYDDPAVQARIAARLLTDVEFNGIP